MGFSISKLDSLTLDEIKNLQERIEANEAKIEDKTHEFLTYLSFITEWATGEPVGVIAKGGIERIVDWLQRLMDTSLEPVAAVAKSSIEVVTSLQKLRQSSLALHFEISRQLNNRESKLKPEGFLTDDLKRGKEIETEIEIKVPSNDYRIMIDRLLHCVNEIDCLVNYESLIFGNYVNMNVRPELLFGKYYGTIDENHRIIDTDEIFSIKLHKIIFQQHEAISFVLSNLSNLQYCVERLRNDFEKAALERKLIKNCEFKQIQYLFKE